MAASTVVGRVVVDADHADLTTSLLSIGDTLFNLEAVQHPGKGKDRVVALGDSNAEPLSDEEYAIKLQEEFLQDALQVMEDYKIAKNLADLDGNSSPSIAAHQAAVDPLCGLFNPHVASDGSNKSKDDMSNADSVGPTPAPNDKDNIIYEDVFVQRNSAENRQALLALSVIAGLPGPSGVVGGPTNSKLPGPRQTDPKHLDYGTCPSPALSDEDYPWHLLDDDPIPEPVKSSPWKAYMENCKAAPVSPVSPGPPRPPGTVSNPEQSALNGAIKPSVEMIKDRKTSARRLTVVEVPDSDDEDEAGEVSEILGISGNVDEEFTSGNAKGPVGDSQGGFPRGLDDLHDSRTSRARKAPPSPVPSKRARTSLEGALPGSTESLPAVSERDAGTAGPSGTVSGGLENSRGTLGTDPSENLMLELPNIWDDTEQDEGTLSPVPDEHHKEPPPPRPKTPDITEVLGEQFGYRTVFCLPCGDLIVGEPTLRAPCGHDICVDCVQGLVAAAIREESQYPPRCCHQPLPSASFASFLTVTLQTDFETKSIEFLTPHPQRLFCPNVTCSIFIGSSEGAGDSVACPRCATVMCPLCRALAHPGDTCSENIQTEEVRRLAQQKNWQTCPKCRAIVDKNMGCNHMVCILCKTNFCYRCGKMMGSLPGLCRGC